MLCDGDERAVRYVTEHLVVGQALGSVNERVPTVPLEADLVRTCRTLRVRREPDLRHWDLDLRRPIDRNRSQLFHRLRLLELDWVRPAEQRHREPGHVPRGLGVALAAGVLRAAGRGVGLGHHGGGRRHRPGRPDPRATGPCRS